MASNTPTPAAPAGPSQAQISSRHPPQREGAGYFLSRAEQALADAMMRSSPAPEPLLGKRGRVGDQPGDGDGDEDTEPEDESSTTQTPSINSVTAVVLRYASKKKLRPDQRDEVEAFFSVSAFLSFQMLLSNAFNIGHCSWPAG